MASPLLRRLRMDVALAALAAGVLPASAAARDADADSADQSPAAHHDSRVPGADALLRKIDAADWRQRRQIVAQVVRQGAEAEPLLRDLLRHDLDLEARKNVEAALRAIDESLLVGPSPITMHVKDAGPREVFEQLSHQCGSAIATSPDSLWEQGGWPKLTLDCDRRPFWEVVRELSDRLNLQYLSTDSQQLRFARGTAPSAGAVSISGAFLISADAEAFRNRLKVNLSVFGEPKIRVLRRSLVALDQARDDQGNPLVPLVGRRGPFGPGFGRGFGFARRGLLGGRQIALYFARTNEDMARIGQLGGKVAVVVQTGSANWQINHPLESPPQTCCVDLLPVTLGRLTANPAGTLYSLRASYPRALLVPGAADEIEDLIRGGMRVLDAEGHPLSLTSVDTQSGGDTVEVSIEFSAAALTGGQKTGEPARLTWQIPVETRRLTVPFRLTDVDVARPFD